MGWSYEQFAPGATYETAGRRLTETDIGAFAELTGDDNALHMDAAYAATCGYGGVITHGPMIVGIAFGLAAPLLSYSVVALLEMSWTFKRAVWPGDSVTALVRVTDRQPSRRPDRGVVTLALDILNQHRDLVQTATVKLLVRRESNEETK
jgi:acyl dehydratase